MKKLYYLFTIIIIFTPLFPSDMHITVGAKSTKKMPTAIGIIGTKSLILEEMCQIIHNDLAFTGQFDPTIEHITKINSKQDLKEITDKGNSLFIGINEKKPGQIEWRIYDISKIKMLKGKSFTPSIVEPRSCGHKIADQILETLTGNHGFFSTKLTYIKEKNNKSHICISDFDGSHEQIIISSHAKIFAPRWNTDQLNPIILYSEYTPSNIRLMAVDMKGKKWVASDFEGLNMQSTFSSDGKEVIICLSRDGSSQLYKYGFNPKHKKFCYERLTNNSGNNVSPTLLANNDIIFCSDYENNSPQIYRLNAHNKSIERLTYDGICTSPNYCPENNTIAYSKIVNGTSQIITLNLATKKEQQLTHSQSHKEECSWSPCGNYLLYGARSNEKKHQIICHNLLTNEQRVMTSDIIAHSYPSWSPYYDNFPLIG